MEQLKQNYKNILSLGWICTVSNLLLSVGIVNIETGVFDNIATPMWAVTELIANDFAHFTETTVKDKLFEGSDELTIYDPLYFARFMGKDNTTPGFERFKSKLLTQAGKLMDLIKTTTDKTLFIRQQEPATNTRYGKRIERPEYVAKYAISEKTHLINFSKAVKALNPGLDFKIMYISDEGNFTDDANNIIGVTNPPTNNYQDPSIAKIMFNQVNANTSFINAHMALAPHVVKNVLSRRSVPVAAPKIEKVVSPVSVSAPAKIVRPVEPRKRVKTGALTRRV